jgi:hypothetical protein
MTTVEITISDALAKEAAAGTAQMISSVPLLDELHDLLSRKKFAAQLAEQGVGAVDLFEGYVGVSDKDTVLPSVFTVHLPRT